MSYGEVTAWTGSVNNVLCIRDRKLSEHGLESSSIYFIWNWAVSKKNVQIFIGSRTENLFQFLSLVASEMAVNFYRDFDIRRRELGYHHAS
jgi:hypothetical protein